ncbi:MAG: hypothetical protein DMF06_03275 [Verrucomicrobia bacterium]|nr:MAG: hypothetical protein DMF06_03275 [Verrucomicrobiota bacterium]
MSLTPLFQTWYKIIERCTNPSNRNYHQYGARGITICDEWRNSFLEFHKYASQLDHFGEKGYSIDRINNSLGYQPENIRYATQHQQSRNKRTNVMITHSGETKCLKDWASSVNMSVGTLQRRIKLGWPTDKVLTQRPRKMNTTK